MFQRTDVLKNVVNSRNDYDRVTKIRDLPKKTSLQVFSKFSFEKFETKFFMENLLAIDSGVYVCHFWAE